jgi:hypothetical protein
MPILEATYHTTRKQPHYADGTKIGLLPPQLGDRDRIDFSGGVAEGAVPEQPVIARCYARDADCRVAVVEDGQHATAATSMLVLAGTFCEPLEVRAGQCISVLADD